MDIAATTRRAYDLINAGDLNGFYEFVAEDFIEHDEMSGIPPTKQGVAELFEMYRAAFPDLRLHADEVLVSGSKTVTRARATGTHQGHAADRQKRRSEIHRHPRVRRRRPDGRALGDHGHVGDDAAARRDSPGRRVDGRHCFRTLTGSELSPQAAARGCPRCRSA